tara:strand:- start:1105 stop:1509 length:405 start_codon:yes stop_codon:yes gene_type:complete
MGNVKTAKETHTRVAEYRDGSGRRSHQEITIEAVQAPCTCVDCCENHDGLRGEGPSRHTRHTITWYITKTKFILCEGKPREEVCKGMAVAEITRDCDWNVNARISKQASSGEASGRCSDHIHRTFSAAMVIETL